MDTLTNDQLLRSIQKTLKTIRSATSSLESQVGHLHSNLQDGQQIDLFGQGHHHANHSQLQETKKEKMTSDTSGPCSSISSASVSLQRSLESRLRQQLDTDGSAIYKLTWKQKATPAQWQYCQLAASTPRIKGTDCSTLPSGWATPNSRDWKDTPGQTTDREAGRKRFDQVPRQAFGIVAPWPTPSATKNTKNSKDPKKLKENGVQTSLADAAWLTRISGDTPNSSTAEMESTAPSQKLNPNFSLWLMGFPSSWLVCGMRAKKK